MGSRNAEECADSQQQKNYGCHFRAFWDCVPNAME